MITTLTIKKTVKRHFTNRLYHNKNKDVTYTFSDGVNIITGRNGSGKSVLLNMIKIKCGIDKDSTYPSMAHPLEIHRIMSDNWLTIPELITNRLGNIGYPSLDLDWDGGIVHHLTPEFYNANSMWRRLDSPLPKSDELYSGVEVLLKGMSTGSKGEMSIDLLNRINNLKTQYDSPLTGVNSSWARASDIFHNWLGDFPLQKGKPTLLIDELDTNLDLDNQYIYWKYLNQLAKKWQVIVVSHSIFAFTQKNVNYINLSRGYLRLVRNIVSVK